MLVLVGSRAAYATTYTVTDTTDNASDSDSLRYAVNSAGDGDTINFASNVIGTITLTNGTLSINHSVTITGPGAALLAISGGNSNGNNVAFRIGFGVTATISQLSIVDNNTVASSGGGFVGGAIYNSGTLTLFACDISNNTAGDGGGAIGNQGTLTVEYSILSGNTGKNNVGGAIENSGTLTVEDSTISGNKSDSNGGGIYNNGALTVENSTIYGNSGSNGGGIYSQNGGGPASLTVANATISGNTASGSGGGIDNNSGTLGVNNSIVSGNTGGDCSSCGTQSSYNLFGGTADLGPLQYNGGTTQTMMPLPGSPAIAAGSGSSLATDQRGFVRPGGTSDLGAVQTNYLTVTTLTDSDDGSCGSTCSLRDAMNAAIADSSGDIIFQSGLTGMITLTSSLPSISAHNLNIAGPGANQLTISGNHAYLIMDLAGTVQQVNISGLTIANGSVHTGYAAGIRNSGVLIAENVAFTLNDGVKGGAIYNDGTLVLQNSTFYNNFATSGGGIANASTGKLVVANSTFNDNRAYNGNGGALDNNGGVMLVTSSTISGNNSLNGGVGAGISNDSGTLFLVNSIASGNTNLQSSTEDDCNNCGTQSTTYNLIGSNANLNLGSLAYNGANATLQTMLPLPGSAAIQAGDPTQLLSGITMDQRGFPRLTGGNLDLGAAQTNFTSVQFVTQPSNTIINADINPAVTAEVLETNTNLAAPNNTDAVNGIPITLSLSGSGTLGGTLTQTTSGGAASFGDLTVNAANTGDTLSTAPISVSSSLTLPSVTSNAFDVTLITPTVAFTSAPPATVTYGVAPITLSATATASGTPTGQTITYSVDSGSATISGNVLTITGVGTVVVEADAAANSTYAAGDTTASIVVNQANLTVTGTNASRAYGAANPIFTGTYSGAVNGDTFTVSGTTTATATSGVGSYPITPTATGTNLADYSVTYVNGSLSVSQANLTVTAANASRAYGAANPIFIGIYTGEVNGDTFNVSGTTAATATSGVGSYPITPTATGTNLADYSVTYVNGSLSVSQANLTVTAANATRAYGTANPIFTGTYTGAVNGDTFNISGTTTATATSAVGSYPITPTATGTKLADYSVTYVNGSLSVSQANLTVTAANASRAYGAANPIFTGTYTGAVNGDTFTISGTTTATTTSAIGSYLITPTATGTKLADYSITYVNGSLSVSQANLTVTTANATRVYGTPNPAFSGAVTGAVNGDTFTESFSTTATQNSNAGSYPIVPMVAGANLADYSVAVSNGVLTVAQAASKLALTAFSSQVGSGLPVTLTATATSTTTGIPTGTVTFLDGGSQLGTAPLNAQGVATLAVSTLPVGSNIVTAGYAGDTNFAGSQAQISSAIVVAPSTFTMTGTPSSLAIEPGQAGLLTLTLTPAFGYSGTVTFSCSGLPINSQCSFQPSSITLSGSTPVNVPVLIEIGPLGLKKTGNTAQLRHPNPLHQLPLLLPAVIFWLPGTELDFEEKSTPSKRKAKSGRMLLLVAILAFSAGLLGLSGCAGLSPYNSSNNPAPGVRTITVTATGSNGVTQTLAVQVTVQ